jgi:hypothetical protein
MNSKNYGAYEVLLGVFDNFLINNKRYDHNNEKFNRFFCDRREKYSVLDNLAFDSDRIFPISKELDEAHSHLIGSRFLNWYDIKPSIEYPNKDLFHISFNKFSKQKFNDSELKELEQLSLEFQKEFCQEKPLKKLNLHNLQQNSYLL